MSKSKNSLVMGLVFAGLNLAASILMFHQAHRLLDRLPVLAVASAAAGLLGLALSFYLSLRGLPEMPQGNGRRGVLPGSGNHAVER